MSFLKVLWSAVQGILFPNHCCLCERRLGEGEECICHACYNFLPFTGFHGQKGNVVERLFWHQLPIARANALLYYKVGADSCHLFFDLKYYDRPEVGIYFGRIMAKDVLAEGFFEGIDAIVPVPLAKEKLRKRGYNQSEMLARGIAAVTGLPVYTDVVLRKIDTDTQTRLTAQERMENVKDAFEVVNVSKIEGRHLLLVDDVLTSGATLLSLGKTLTIARGISISILTLGIAGHHSMAEHLNDIEPLFE